MSDAWLEGVTAALDAAGAVIRPYFRAGVAAEQKTDESPVTIADRLAEETLREVLAARFPDYGIVGEELPPHNEGAGRVWVIDPIDGTRAFITGRPSFCTLVGLLEDGVPVFGAIDQPVTGERWIGGAGVSASPARSAARWARVPSPTSRRRNSLPPRRKCSASICRASID